MNATRRLHKIAQNDISDATQDIGETIMKILIFMSNASVSYSKKQRTDDSVAACYK
jgi:hypothetical protein